ncbi:MAG TPA: hypothetical protein VIW29_23075 [Polyangiaceae bacterium]
MRGGQDSAANTYQRPRELPNVALTTSAGAPTELGQLYTSLAHSPACPK